MAVGAVGAIVAVRNAGDSRGQDDGLGLGTFKFTYIDVLDQTNLKEPMRLAVPMAFTPRPARMKNIKKMNLMQDKEAACRWLSRALQKSVTAIYLQKRGDDGWRLLPFPLQDDSPPFLEGTVVVVCCNGQTLDSDVTKNLPLNQLQKTKTRGVFNWINTAVKSLSGSHDKDKASPAAEMTTHVADVRKSLQELQAVKEETPQKEIQLDEELLAAAIEEPAAEDASKDDLARRKEDRKTSIANLTKNLNNIAAILEQHGSSIVSEMSQSSGPDSPLAIEQPEAISSQLRGLAATLEVDALSLAIDEFVEPLRASSKDSTRLHSISPDVPPRAATPTNPPNAFFCFSAACYNNGCKDGAQEDDEELADVKRV